LGDLEKLKLIKK